LEYPLYIRIAMAEPPWPPPNIHSHTDLIQYHYSQYDKRLRTGEFEPFVYPWGAFGALIVILYLLIPHRNRPWLRKLRFFVFAWNTGFSAYTIRYTRAKAMAPAMGLGLISAWSVIWVMSILVVHDAQTEFQRIERTEGVFRGQPLKRQEYGMNLSNGSATKRDEGQSISNVSGTLGPADRHGEFAWQPYPLKPFAERLDWVLDVFCNFRGVGWNWRTSSIPPPPSSVQEQLRRNSAGTPSHSTRIHTGQPYTYPTRRELLRGNLKLFLTGYLVLDVLKTVMMHDPYFWGFTDHPAPSHLPSVISNSPVLLRMYRLALSQLGIQWALKTVFSLAPLFFSGLLGPSVIGARAEPWMYPETWGPYSMVFERGLAGWWAGWWHQTFRFAFEAPGKELIRALGLQRNAPFARLLQLVIAFTLSGMLHACGSYTAAGPTRPLNLLSFFLLQAAGIFCEALLREILRPAGRKMRMPKSLRSALTFACVHLWFYHTAPLLADDFARGGVWLLEPIPVSFMRALGLGADGEGWWCWSGLSVRWYRGSRSWSSGIAF
jgi:hypothetical protein